MGRSRTSRPKTQSARGPRRSVRRSRPVAALLRLAWRADKGGSSAMLGSTLFDAAAGLGGILAVGYLHDALVANQGQIDNSAWIALGSVGAIFLVQRVAFPFLGPAIESLEHRLTLLVRERVMAPLLRPSTISHLEDPRIADELRQAQQVGSENFSAQQALGAFTEIGGARLAAVGAGVLLSRWKWWAPLVLAAGWLFSRLWYRVQMATLVASMERSTPALRQAEYVGDLVLGGTAAKESRVFGLAPWLTRRFETRWRAGMTQVWAQRRRGRVGTVLNTALIFGAILVFRQDAAVGVVALLLGLWWLIQGAFLVFSVFIDRTDFWWKLILGLLGVTAGIVVLANPVQSGEFLGSALAVVLGIIGLIVAVVAIIGGFRGGGFSSILFGVVSGIIALLLLFYPEGSFTTMVTILGIVMMVEGFIAIFLGLSTRSSRPTTG